MDNKTNQEIIEALIEVESKHDETAHNQLTGARGLTQITPEAWKELVAHYPERYGKLSFEKDMFKGEIAKQAGMDYLNILIGYLRSKQMPDTFDNIIASYNWGVDKVSNLGLENAPADVKNYITKIRELLEPTARMYDSKHDK